MKLLEDIERRLLNWARWKIGGGSGGLGYSGVNFAAMMGASSARYREATVPTNDSEASDTDQAVASLASELKATVEAHYLGSGSQRKTAERLCCSQDTVKRRLHRAHLHIADWLHTRRVAAEAERERVRNAMDQARP